MLQAKGCPISADAQATRPSAALACLPNPAAALLALAPLAEVRADAHRPAFLALVSPALVQAEPRPPTVLALVPLALVMAGFQPPTLLALATDALVRAETAWLPVLGIPRCLFCASCRQLCRAAEPLHSCIAAEPVRYVHLNQGAPYKRERHLWRTPHPLCLALDMKTRGAKNLLHLKTQRFVWSPKSVLYHVPPEKMRSPRRSWALNCAFRHLILRKARPTCATDRVRGALAAPPAPGSLARK